MVFYNPKDILVEMLRHRLTDPNSNRTYTTQTEEFDGDNSTTTFSLTPTANSMQYVSAITVDAVAVNKWEDYYIDMQNEDIVFLSAPASGTNNVDVTYFYSSTSWIYPDRPRQDLGANSYPRISVETLAPTSEQMGNKNADFLFEYNFVITVWALEDQDYTIGGVVYTNDSLTEYFLFQIMKALRENIDDIYPALFNPRNIVMRNNILDKENQVYSGVLEVTFNFDQAYVK